MENCKVVHVYTRSERDDTFTLESDPIKRKQTPAFLITYVLRGVLSSSFLWSTLSTPPLRTGAPSLPFLPLPDAAVFQWEESGDAAPEANAPPQRYIYLWVNNVKLL